MWVLQGAIWSWPRDVSNFLLSFFFFSSPRASFRQAGAPLPTPAATTAFIKALPPNQTPFVRETAPEAALLEQMPPCPAVIITSAFPECHTPAHPHVCARYLPALLSSVRDVGHRALFPELYSRFQPHEHPGTSVWASEPLSASGLPRHSTHPGRS